MAKKVSYPCPECGLFQEHRIDCVEFTGENEPREFLVSRCSGCPFERDDGFSARMCRLSNSLLPGSDVQNLAPAWCPLRHSGALVVLKACALKGGE